MFQENQSIANEIGREYSLNNIFMKGSTPALYACKADDGIFK